MTIDEHKQVLEQLKTAESEADKLTLLMQLETDYTGVLSERDSALEEKTKAVSDREKYAKLTSQLILENSSQKALVQNNTTETNTTLNQEPPKKREFGDLEAKLEEEYGGK